jgi:hypothetical protein
MTKFKTYTCSYRFGGAQYGFEIAARDMSEAQARLATIKAWGQVDGEVIATIPAAPGAGLLARMICALRNGLHA